jgi:hypothetical protein
VCCFVQRGHDDGTSEDESSCDAFDGTTRVVAAVADWLHGSVGDPTAYLRNLRAAERFIAGVVDSAPPVPVKRQRRHVASLTQDTPGTLHSSNIRGHKRQNPDTLAVDNGDRLRRPPAVASGQPPAVTAAHRPAGPSALHLPGSLLSLPPVAPRSYPSASVPWYASLPVPSASATGVASAARPADGQPCADVGAQQRDGGSN